MKQTRRSLITWNEKIDLSDKEKSRTYRFPQNEYVTIDSPQFLIVSDNGHRILDGQGRSYYIPYGWIVLRWENKSPNVHDSFVCLQAEPSELPEPPEPPAAVPCA